MAQISLLDTHLFTLAPASPSWPSFPLALADDEVDDEAADEDDEEDEDDLDDEDDEDADDEEDEDSDEEDDDDDDEEDDDDVDEEDEASDDEGGTQARTAEGQLRRQNGHRLTDGLSRRSA